jgi:hypothetical protein
LEVESDPLNKMEFFTLVSISIVMINGVLLDSSAKSMLATEDTLLLSRQKMKIEFIAYLTAGLISAVIITYIFVILKYGRSTVVKSNRKEVKPANVTHFNPMLPKGNVVVLDRTDSESAVSPVTSPVGSLPSSALRVTNSVVGLDEGLKKRHTKSMNV